MKEKIQALMYEFFTTLGESTLYLSCSFIGIAINLFVVHGIISYKNGTYSFSTLFQIMSSNELLFSILTSIISVLIGIAVFYYKRESKRDLLMLFVTVCLMVSFIFSVITLIQSQISEMFPKKVLTIGTFIAFLIMYVATFMFKYDSDDALKKLKIQNKANEYKSLENITLGDSKIKL